MAPDFAKQPLKFEEKMNTYVATIHFTDGSKQDFEFEAPSHTAAATRAWEIYNEQKTQTGDKFMHYNVSLA